MKISKSFLLLVLAVTSCTLSKKNAIGKWVVSINDTMIVKKDMTIVLYKTNPGIQQKDSVFGKWDVRRTSLMLVFSDTSHHLGNGCNSVQFMWTKGPKRILFMPYNCKGIPSNRFTSIHKIE